MRRKRDFLTLADLSAQEVWSLLRRARAMKRAGKPWRTRRLLAGRTLGMIFEKASTRTRVSFEVGMAQLGGQALFLSTQDLQLGRGESVGDTARVLSRYVQAILLRTYAHATVEDFARHATVPVINGLTDLHHPCQALADLLTLLEKKGRLRGLRVAYVGDGNNVAHSLMEGAARVGLHMRLACPQGYEPDAGILARSRQEAEAAGGSIQVVRDPEEAVAGADAVYTDVWTSMGQEAEQQERRRAFRGYQVHARLMALAHPDAVFMHCLPAHRGEEVSAEVLDGPGSVVWDQAENRLHAQKALLVWLMAGSR